MTTMLKRVAVAALLTLAPALVWAGEKVASCCCPGCPCGM